MNPSVAAHHQRTFGEVGGLGGGRQAGLGTRGGFAGVGSQVRGDGLRDRPPLGLERASTSVGYAGAVQGRTGSDHLAGGDRDVGAGVRDQRGASDLRSRPGNGFARDTQGRIFPNLGGSNEGDLSAASLAQRRRRGTPPAYPPPQVHSLSTQPGLHTGSSASGHGSASSAGSRSVPPGSRASTGRPHTPTSSSAVSRRGGDDPLGAGVPRLGGPCGGSTVGEGLLGGRSTGDSQQTASRSRSMAAPGGTNDSTPSGSSPVCCDKCDGRHPTDRCPHFNREREKHKDAWVNYGRKGGPHQMGAAGGNYVLKSARVVRQPGDGSCLFHSLSHGLGAAGGGAASLRREIASFLQQHPALQVAGDTLEEWVRWDSNASVADYARRMASCGWGGGIEMVACSLLKNVNVHVYENARSGCGEFKRISCFDCPNAPRTIHVLYQGGVHYDALVPLAA
eukprot:TRINITY_DN35121_c0_g1_i1.p1 TRINITY_DN35121_c0_g1~~TRINITY_DN35121_c0_g1_i1.p1  ORF type:complete len:450 (-),score=56.24 TRINITY_DN35121_c0_g1_i1:418-1767(-)